MVGTRRDRQDRGGTQVGFAQWGQPEDGTGQAVERVINLRGSTPAQWPERIISTEDAVCPSIAVTIEHGQVVVRGVGGAGQRSNRRSIIGIPGSPGGYSRVRSRVLTTPANPAVANTLGQHGHAHGMQLTADGRWLAAVVTDDITFGPTVQNLSLWKQETAPGSVGAEFTLGNPLDQLAVTAAVRSSNVVTLTVTPPTGQTEHGYGRGDVVTVDLADNSYDGTFQVSSVTATQIVYGQTAANAGTSTGTVKRPQQTNVKDQLTRSTAVSASSRTNGLVTAVVAAGHPWRIGDEVAVDLAVGSYDGVFKITELPSSTQIRWRQAAGDDAAGGAGTISNAMPYWLETEWWPGLLRARVWPDFTAAGRAVPTAPSWESDWAESVSVTGLATTEPDPGLGQSAGLVVAHPASGAAAFPTEHRYDSVSCAALVI
jgi:hypothetical protein